MLQSKTNVSACVPMWFSIWISICNSCTVGSYIFFFFSLLQLIVICMFVCLLVFHSLKYNKDEQIICFASKQLLVTVGLPFHSLFYVSNCFCIWNFEWKIKLCQTFYQRDLAIRKSITYSFFFFFWLSKTINVTLFNPL